MLQPMAHCHDISRDSSFIVYITNHPKDYSRMFPINHHGIPVSPECLSASYIFPVVPMVTI